MELSRVVPECFVPFRGGFAGLQNPTALGEGVALNGGVGVGSGGDTVSSKLEDRGEISLACTTSAVQVCGFNNVCLSGIRDFKSCEKQERKWCS